jgi:hypothetical protein
MKPGSNLITPHPIKRVKAIKSCESSAIKVMGIWMDSCLNELTHPPTPKATARQVSRESVYNVYTVDNQWLKCLHNPLHFWKSVYIVGNQQSKCLH